MKALILKGPNEPFTFEDVPDPIPQNGEAVAKVLACGSGLTIQHVKSGRTKVNFPIPFSPDNISTFGNLEILCNSTISFSSFSKPNKINDGS